jgi:hypothetical protein
MQRRGPGALTLVAFLGGIVIGCGQAEQQPAKPPPSDQKARYEREQQKMQESMKEHGLQGAPSDKDKGKDMDKDKTGAKDEKK